MQANQDKPAKDSPVYYHTLLPMHAAIYRLVRLRALSESPVQFSSTFAREFAFTEQTWESRLSNPDAICIIASSRLSLDEKSSEVDEIQAYSWDEPSQFAVSDLEYHGIVVGIRAFDDPKKAYLVSFWVSPLSRRRQIGRTLVSKVVEWAKCHLNQRTKFDSVILDVQKDNSPARRLYESCGFLEEGQSVDDPSEIHYTLSLNSDT
jgi:ribosomal protein S18 acetylase RimI-like enzyme